MFRKQHIIAPRNYQLEKDGAVTRENWTTIKERYFASTKSFRATPDDIMNWYRANGWKVTRIARP